MLVVVVAAKEPKAAFSPSQCVACVRASLPTSAGQAGGTCVRSGDVPRRARAGACRASLIDTWPSALLPPCPARLRPAPHSSNQAIYRPRAHVISTGRAVRLSPPPFPRSLTKPFPASVAGSVCVPFSFGRAHTRTPSPSSPRRRGEAGRRRAAQLVLGRARRQTLSTWPRPCC